MSSTLYQIPLTCLSLFSPLMEWRVPLGNPCLHTLTRSDRQHGMTGPRPLDRRISRLMWREERRDKEKESEQVSGKMRDHQQQRILLLINRSFSLSSGKGVLGTTLGSACTSSIDDCFFSLIDLLLATTPTHPHAYTWMRRRGSATRG